MLRFAGSSCADNRTVEPGEESAAESGEIDVEGESSESCDSESDNSSLYTPTPPCLDKAFPMDSPNKLPYLNWQDM